MQYSQPLFSNLVKIVVITEATISTTNVVKLKDATVPDSIIKVKARAQTKTEIIHQKQYWMLKFFLFVSCLMLL